jgi:hypothetical protein
MERFLARELPQLWPMHGCRTTGTISRGWNTEKAVAPPGPLPHGTAAGIMGQPHDLPKRQESRAKFEIRISNMDQVEEELLRCCQLGDETALDALARRG